MLRQASIDRLRQALKARDLPTVSTTRLILTGLKDRDVAARGQGGPEGLSDAKIQQMLQTMIKQRRESIALYEQGNPVDLAQQQPEEIAVIESFLPRQLEQDEIESAAASVITETGAAGIKDMGRVMAALRERYAGAVDLRTGGCCREVASWLIRWMIEGHKYNSIWPQGCFAAAVVMPSGKGRMR
jgi:uncharacterized protein